MRVWGTIVVALGVLFPLSLTAQERIIDSATGLTIAGDWQLVRDNCTACHSARLIIQQRGDTRQWITTIRWMQRTQNLWRFPDDVEKKIVAYLAEHYPARGDRRRAPIPPALRPPNPYASR